MTFGYVQEALSVLNGLHPGRFECETLESPLVIKDTKNGVDMQETFEVKETVYNLITKTARVIQRAYDWGIVTREGK